MASPLKELLKGMPSEAAPALNEIRTGSPRSSAALASAIVEDMLADVIKLNMVKLSKGHLDQLFNGTAPLATFAARSKIAHAFGIVGRRALADLDRFREIRNVFVHSKLMLTFETEEIAKSCQNFHCLSEIDPEHGNSMSPRECFTAAFHILTMYLVSKLEPPETVISKAEKATLAQLYDRRDT